MGFKTSALLTGASLLGTGLQAYGQYKSAQDEAAAEEYNAAIARQEADIAGKKGKLDVDRQRKLARRFGATQTVLIARSGVAFQGSSLEVWKDTQEELEMDALIMEYNTAVDQTRALNEAQIREDRADRVRYAGTISSISTVLKQSSSFIAAQGTKKSGKGKG